MKVLLDEDLAHVLRLHLPGHEVFTVAYVGWGGLRNGELLKTAEAGGFEVFVTGDQSMRYEQNLSGRKLAIVMLSAIKWRIRAFRERQDRDVGRDQALRDGRMAHEMEADGGDIRQ